MTSNSDIIKKTMPVLDGFTTYLQVFFCLLIASFIAGAPSSIYEAVSGNPLFLEFNYGEPIAFSSESILISSIVLLLVFYLILLLNFLLMKKLIIVLKFCLYCHLFHFWQCLILKMWFIC